jgi:hypothetical protein
MTSTYYLLKASLSLNLDSGYFKTVLVMLKSSSFVDGVRFPV